MDIGNSAAKAALVDGSTVRSSGRLDTAVATTADLVAGLRLLAARSPEPPTAILAVSVVDRWSVRLEQAAEDVGLPVTMATWQTIPLPTALPRPDLTGPDRLLAGWAAARLHGRPVIVVDLGTATTVDAIDADGFFLGGAILPGLGLAAAALAEGTSRLPRVELDLPTEAIGVDTVSAIQSGVVVGHLGSVREIVAHMRARIARDVPLGLAPRSLAAAATAQHAVAAVPRVVVTGGHAGAAWAERAWCEPAGPTLPAIADIVDAELILRGLGLLAEHLAAPPGAGALP